MTTQIQLDVDFSAIEDVCQEFSVRKMALFGSVLRDDFNTDSDIDVLVEFISGATITYLDMAGLQYALQDVFGYPVDLVTPNALSPYFRDDILQQGHVIYERE